MKDLSFVPVYVVFGVLGFLGFLAAVLVLYAHCFSSKRKNCCMLGQHDDQVQPETTDTGGEAQTSTAAQNYAVLEDHLDLVDSPEGSPTLGPAPKKLSRKKGLQQPQQEKTQSPEKGIFTMEFLPDNNTIISIEGAGNRVRRITRTNITLKERLRQRGEFSVQKGLLSGAPVCVHSLPLFRHQESTDPGGAEYERIKREIVASDKDIVRLTPHPRFVRYLGTCFNPLMQEAYVITDFVAGSTIKEIRDSDVIASLVKLKETEKIQAAADVADAVYFLHGHSKPVVHGNISLSSVIIDGETHRAKLFAKEASDRMQDIFAKKSHPNSALAHDKFLFSTDGIQERSPEVLSLRNLGLPDYLVKADLWSLGATICEFLFDENVWDLKGLTREFNTMDQRDALLLAMEAQQEPPIVHAVRGANPRLQFLVSCFSYNPEERPAAAVIARGLQQLVVENQREEGRRGADLEHVSSNLFPNKRIVNSARKRQLDPLVQQQIKFNVAQDAGYKRRALMFCQRSYLGERFRSLSVTPLNDLKDLSSLLQVGGFGLANTYESISSRQHFEDLLKAYVAAVNKEPEEVDILLVYFTGQGVQGLPHKLEQKRRLGIFLDRVGISHDLALVTKNETLFPVSKLQTILAELNSKVKRKVIILDCRLATRSSKRQQEPRDPFSMGASPIHGLTPKVNDYHVDWDVPIISEECLDKLTTMFTIYPTVEKGVSLAAVDSHPRRANGFLTGCLINVLRDYNSRPSIEELPRYLMEEMTMEAAKAKSFAGIECKADYIQVGNNIWMVPFLSKQQ